MSFPDQLFPDALSLWCQESIKSLSHSSRPLEITKYTALQLNYSSQMYHCHCQQHCPIKVYCATVPICIHCSHVYTLSHTFIKKKEEVRTGTAFHFEQNSIHLVDISAF